MNYQNESDLLGWYLVNYVHGLLSYRFRIQKINLRLLTSGFLFDNNKINLFIPHNQITKFELTSNFTSPSVNPVYAGKSLKEMCFEITFFDNMNNVNVALFEMRKSLQLDCNQNPCYDLIDRLKDNGIFHGLT